MPGSSVSVADYLAIDIACRHFSTQISRSAIARYFSITVNALNARLRTCSDRLKPFPTLAEVGVQVIRVAERLGQLKMRPAPADAAAVARTGKSSPRQMFMHPIWLLSQQLLLQMEAKQLDDDIVGLYQGQGALVKWFCEVEVHAKQLLPDDAQLPPEIPVLTDDRGRRYVKIVPVTRPEETEEALDLSTGRKRRHDGVFIAPALRPPTTEEEELGMPVFGPEKLTDDLIATNSLPTNAERRVRRDEDRPIVRTSLDAGDTVGRNSRTDPFSPHDLLVVYISRKIRFLDWDAVSWALSRYKTPVIACLGEAKATYEPHHDQILETMRLCCWPENSMYLISLAAHEILGCLERGTWAEELEGFKQGKGFLYALHMQRQVERMVRRVLEQPEERTTRRRRERMLGYSGLGIAEYGDLPDRKRKLGACGAAAIPAPPLPGGSDGLPKLRKRRTRAQIEEQEAEKKRAREVLKAAGLKTNGEPVVKKKIRDENGTRPVNGSSLAPVVKEEKRRKYDLTPKDAAILEQALQSSGSGLHALLRKSREAREAQDVKQDKTPPQMSRASLVNLLDQRSKPPTPSMAIPNEAHPDFDYKLANLQQQLPFDLTQTPRAQPSQPAPASAEERVKKGMSMSFLMN